VSGDLSDCNFLPEADVVLPVKDPCRKHGFSEASYHLWRSSFRRPADRRNQAHFGDIGSPVGHVGSSLNGVGGPNARFLVLAPPFLRQPRRTRH
jgi:hypothetical protein